MAGHLRGVFSEGASIPLPPRADNYNFIFHKCVRNARTAATIYASSVMWDTQVCRRQGVLWLALV
eukprot:8377524-Pyramimonas_sp.AAC.1